MSMTPHPLIEARKRAGYSQQALAEAVGKDRLTILRIERRQTNPPLETVSKIITALAEKHVELSADEFLPTSETKADAA